MAKRHIRVRAHLSNGQVVDYLFDKELFDAVGWLYRLGRSHPADAVKGAVNEAVESMLALADELVLASDYPDEAMRQPTTVR